jgi:ankyrin repeat protein
LLKLSKKKINRYIVKLLIQYGADIHIDNDEPLLRAIRNDDLPMVKLLVQNGANLHARDFMRAANSKEMKHYIKQRL